MLYQGFSSKSFCLENHVLEGVWQWGYEFFCDADNKDKSM